MAYWEGIWAWIQAHESLVWWLGAGSLVMFLASLVIVPFLIVRMPADYFAANRDLTNSFVNQHPMLRWFVISIKNAVGSVLVIAGLAMLLLPGQGVLTMLIGLSLMNFPGKRDLERRIVKQRSVLKAINWIRARYDQRALILD